MKDYSTGRLHIIRDQLLALIKLDSSDLQARKRLLSINQELARRDRGPRIFSPSIIRPPDSVWRR